MNEIKEYTEKIFDDIKHIDEFGNEYWYARELMVALEYKEWRKFDKVIKKAMEACLGSNYYILDHFVLIDKMVSIGSNTIKELGGTMPEDLPTPKKSLKEIEKENINLIEKKGC